MFLGTFIDNDVGRMIFFVMWLLLGGFIVTIWCAQLLNMPCPNCGKLAHLGQGAFGRIIIPEHCRYCGNCFALGVAPLTGHR